MQSLFQDLQFGVRNLRRQPLFTCIAVLTLALGVGANTAVFSMINAVLLRPLPYPQPERLILLRENSPTFAHGSVSHPNYLDWRAAQRSFTDLAQFRRESMNLAGASGGQAPPERVGAARVTANFLSVLRLRPQLGRDFTEAEDAPGGPRAVMLSDRLWRTRFGADPGVIGRRVLVDALYREVAGVLPPELRWPRGADLYVPLGELRVMPNVLSRASAQGFSVLGRLKDGVSLTQARADLDGIARELARRYPATNADRSIWSERLLESAVGDYRQSLYLLLGAVGCVLLIACGNVANLQLARAVARQKELAVRAVLGASRGRLVRQLLTESLLLAALGGAGGVLLALWGTDAILTFSPAEAPRFQETRLDWVTLAFSGAVTMGAGILIGVWPAWRLCRVPVLAAHLRESNAGGNSAGAGQRRTQALLVVAQVALAAVLLTGAALLLKSFGQVLRVPLGFDPGGVLQADLTLPGARYDADEKVAAFYARLLERVQALPGVRAAAIGHNVPFDDNEDDNTFHLTGEPPSLPGNAPSAEVCAASPDYFRALGVPIVRGRSFGPQDAAGAPWAAIIDENFAQRWFPGQNPLGRHIDNPVDDSAPPLTIVGVAARTRNGAPGDGLETLELPQLYFSAAQAPVRSQVLLVRVAAGDPLALAEAIRREVRAIDPDQPVSSVSTMNRHIAASLAPRRLTMALLAAFAALALSLASVGLYGVMALSVAQRTRELGIRLALGATRGHVFQLVLRQGMSLVAIGMMLGLLGALGGGRALASLLYGVKALDPLALAAAAGALGTAAACACLLPAHRATRINPLVALRED